MLDILFPAGILAMLNAVLLVATYVSVLKIRAQVSDHVSQLFKIQQVFLEEMVLVPKKEVPKLSDGGPYRIPGKIGEEPIPPLPEIKPKEKSSLDQWQPGWECPRCNADEDQVEIVPYAGDKIQEKAKWMCIRCGCQWESEPIYETADKKMLCYKCNKELRKSWYCTEHGSLASSTVEEYNRR